MLRSCKKLNELGSSLKHAGINWQRAVTVHQLWGPWIYCHKLFISWCNQRLSRFSSHNDGHWKVVCLLQSLITYTFHIYIWMPMGLKKIDMWMNWTGLDLYVIIGKIFLLHSSCVVNVNLQMSSCPCFDNKIHPENRSHSMSPTNVRLDQNKIECLFCPV